MKHKTESDHSGIIFKGPRKIYTKISIFSEIINQAYEKIKKKIESQRLRKATFHTFLRKLLQDVFQKNEEINLENMKMKSTKSGAPRVNLNTWAKQAMTGYM